MTFLRKRLIMVWRGSQSKAERSGPGAGFDEIGANSFHH